LSGAHARPPAESWERFFLISPDPMCVAHVDEGLRRVNPAWEAVLGWTADDLASGRWLEDVHPEDRSAALGKAAELRERGAVNGFTHRCRSKSGAYRWLRWTALMDRDPAWIYAVACDITAERDAEQTFREMFERAPDANLVVGRDGVITTTNEEADRLFRCAPGALVGQSVDALVPAAHRDAHARHRARFFEAPRQRRMAEGRDLVAVRRDGTTVAVDIALAPLPRASPPLTLAVLRDVTARRAMEESLSAMERKLEQGRRLEAIGALAAGVAHDFNNLMSVVHACSQLLLEDTDRDDAARESLEAIHAASTRAANLTRQLLAVGRKQILQPRPLDLNRLIAEMSPILSRLAGDAVALDVVPARGLWSAVLDPTEIEQVVMNLVINARDAMPSGGTVTITTRNVDDAVSLTIRDTGVGMDDEMRRRMFEPFYTTKERSRGTGLGLATVLGIVKQSGGDIFVESEPGRGTSVEVRFPRAAEIAIDPAPVEPAPVARGSETILVVDDDDAVRWVVAKVLRRAGYEVIAAADGEDALRIGGTHPGPIHLVVSDVSMAQMS